MADDKKSGVSRRDLLKRAGLAGAAFTIPLTPVGGGDSAAATPVSAAAGAAQGPPRREPVENLTAAESDLLEAICARIIPTDENGPGAREARAAHVIDRALGGALASSKPAYTAGFAAFDRYCRSSRGKPFTELPARDQDSVLIDVETGAATGFTGSSAAFFAMVRTHTLHGTFGDPYYGGNANFAGWDLIGYPGVRTNVSAEEQRLGVKLAPNHRSAYDYDMFSKAQARMSEPSTPEPSASAASAVALASTKSVAHGH
jgi:gluconate 2-dehydrogenase gamma chain